MNTVKILILSSFLLLAFNAGFSQARVQVLHNSADAAVEKVDIWLDQTRILDDFRYRKASPFTDATAGVPVLISVCPAASENPDEPLWSGNFTFTAGETYVLVADGILSESGYEPVVPFQIYTYAGALETGSGAELTDVLYHHGSTDAPVIDIYETQAGLGLLTDNLNYAAFQGYDELTTENFLFEVRDASGSTIISAFLGAFLDLNLKGKAVTLLASGFLYPENNSNGPSFGLWAAPAEGGSFIELPAYNPLAQVQVIHNSADAAAEVVDVWMNDSLLLDNLAFRTASPFLSIRAESEFTLAIKGADSQNPENPLWSQNYTLTTDETYILVADGILSTSGYEPPVPFGISVFPGGRVAASVPSNTDVLVHHGSTDAPVVDVYETGVGAGLLIDDLGYGEFSEYLELVPQDYIIEIRDAGGIEKIIAFSAPLGTLGLGGEAVTLVASGFLNPGNNSNGPDFGLWMATAEGGALIELPVYDPTARVQIIHNAADDAAQIVDVWVNNARILDDFAFRSASAFMDMEAGTEITISILGPDSQSPENPLWSGNFTLEIDETYILAASGIISPTGYEPPTPFNIAVYPNAREQANNSGQTDLIINHGSTDAGLVDIVEVGIGLGLMYDNLAYGQFTGYFGLATTNYILQVRDENGISKIAAYQLPLATMGTQGDAVTVVASGFLEPDNNSGGPGFGLYMARAEGGELVKLPEYAPKARLQVIHNSADTAVEVVDIWLNQTLILDNFAFRQASAFIDAPANEQITIAIKGPDSQDPFAPVYMHNYYLTEGETYVMVANGIVSPTGYEPSVPFDIALYTGAREQATITGRTDLLVHHGGTDAPVVDVIEVGLGAGTLITDLEYAEFNPYLELPTIDYILEVRDASNNNLLGTFRAPLQTLGLENEAITVVASGFINPGMNSDGAPFGLWAATTDGGPMIELPSYVPSALVQVIHNSADAALAQVDVWLNEDLLLDDFSFRSATPFTYIPANNQFTLSVCAPDSQDPSVPLWSQNYTLTEDEVYIMIADGILSPEGYDPALPFSLFLYTGAAIEAGVAFNTDVLFFHGATDAPTVDIIATGLGTLSDNLSFGAFDGYEEIPTGNYTCELTDESGSTVLGYFALPLADLGLSGKSLTVLASGFANPGANSNGPALGLLTVQVDGTTALLNNTLGISDPVFDPESLDIYPNPATDVMNISFSLKSSMPAVLEVMDMSGRVISKVIPGTGNAGNYLVQMNAAGWAPGLYLVSLSAGSERLIRKVLVR